MSDLGCTPFLLPNQVNSVDAIIDHVKPHILILSGGNDLSARFLDDFNSNSDNKTLLPRETVEFKALQYAVENKIPVLGICHGLQIINAYFEGMLISNIREKVANCLNHVASTHKIKIIKKSRYAPFAEDDSYLVNSFHDHGITKDSLSSQLVALAISDDGIIEAAEHSTLPILGIMWHPERPNSDNQLDHGILKGLLL